jgi:molybdenum cofactor cytidylyltransferase
VKIAAVILAAGEGRRMTVPKQLLPWGDSTFLGHAVIAARGSACSKIMVVIGAHQDLVAREVRDRRIEVVHNPDWMQGLGSSVRAAARAMARSETPVDAAVFLPVDQPLMDSALIDRLIDVHRKSRKPIVASRIQGRLGVPALFDASVFPELLRLTGDGAAQAFICRRINRVRALPFPEGAFDINTPEDYLRWRAQRSRLLSRAPLTRMFGAGAS